MCLNQVSCKRGKTDGETKKNQRENVFFQKTFATFPGVSFAEKHERNKWRNTKNLIKNFKILFCFSCLPRI